LRAGEPFVRLTLEFDNQADDHRLRLHVPLARPSDHSSAEGQYAVVERGLTVEAGHGEVPLATFPAYGWVDAGGVAVLLDNVTEYELLDGRELALTVLRSIGMISRNDNPYREDPAGPERAMPAAQMRGRQRVSLGLMAHRGEWPEAGVPALAERYAHTFVVAAGRRRDEAIDPGPVAGLAVEGAGVVLTALQRRDDWLELRLACESPVPTTAVIGPSVAAWRDVDLLGRAAAEVDGDGGPLSLPFEPWQIRTIQIRR
jgi:alpha-mannosidase